jgi:hypothetical protein
MSCFYSMFAEFHGILAMLESAFGKHAICGLGRF